MQLGESSCIHFISQNKYGFHYSSKNCINWRIKWKIFVQTMMSSLLQHTKSNGRKVKDNSNQVKARWCTACSWCWIVLFILSKSPQSRKGRKVAGNKMSLDLEWEARPVLKRETQAWSNLTTAIDRKDVSCNMRGEGFGNTWRCYFAADSLLVLLYLCLLLHMA